MGKEANIDKNGGVIWLYGISGAGKTTISKLLKEQLSQAGYLSIILDGDELRSGINNDLSFTQADRSENIRRVAEMAKLLAKNNILVICALITPLQEHRALARKIINENFYEIFINCPLEVCESRDVKGLYKLSRAKKIENFTGIDSGFEYANHADLVLLTADSTPQASMQILYDFLLKQF
ncbi:adenylylsulfate kinase [Mucilaginibacter mallensis]|uniref:Adenylyl-sulfate kinase n=1 Tax=Mucilaginibacter mallensis TaxID=652787 RepID=A0A1H1ZD71_MUCMA|nr:adenylyl-sulfate kinase [Mucilaginibacter mallensis]SDT31648.1 adenylylsulfate kinase [Mucilaginibacter mallensis]